MDWVALDNFMKVWGWPGLTLIGLAIFFYRKVWPLAEQLVKGMLENMRIQTALLENIARMLGENSAEIKEHIHQTAKIAEMIRDANKK